MPRANRYFLPGYMLYQQEGLTHSKALIREAQIKVMPRSKKEEIILSEQTEQWGGVTS